MSKADGFLYTGINSVTRDKKSVREQIKEHKQSVQREVEPFAPAIFALIDKEQSDLGLLLAGLVDSDQTPAQVQTHIEAVKLHRDFLIRFSAQIKKNLRLGRSNVVKEEE